ncbi:MAG: hypothetical protein LBT50_02570 [Prevotellaceae bacterium]|jgi:hypothetical protein|nr:hypothetical protein [Prevotellaceae bacterium]
MKTIHQVWSDKYRSRPGFYGLPAGFANPKKEGLCFWSTNPYTPPFGLQIRMNRKNVTLFKNKILLLQHNN